MLFSMKPLIKIYTKFVLKKMTNFPYIDKKESLCRGFVPIAIVVLRILTNHIAV